MGPPRSPKAMRTARPCRTRTLAELPEELLRRGPTKSPRTPSWSSKLLPRLDTGDNTLASLRSSAVVTQPDTPRPVFTPKSTSPFEFLDWVEVGCRGLVQPKFQLPSPIDVSVGEKRDLRS